MRVEFVADPWLPPSDEQILHERTLLASAYRQTRTCRCDSPVEIRDRDGHANCLKCSWPLHARYGRLRRLFRLIARLARNARSARPAGALEQTA